MNETIYFRETAPRGDVSGDGTPVAGLMARARAAMATLEDTGQDQVDAAVRAIAWSLYKPENARALAELAVKDTGLGNAADKTAKNQRKTFGTLRDLMRVRTVGVIAEDAARGLALYAKPVGVVAASTPTTNPAATPINKAMMAVKGRNAIIFAPSPAGWSTTARAVDLARAELEKCGFAPDLMQVMPRPMSLETTVDLMRSADLVVSTGSQDIARAASTSGTPAIGVGTGNVPVVIDDSADLADAAAKIARSKCFDNGTSCSAENALVILDDVYDGALAALRDAGGYLASADEGRELVERMWRGGNLNRALMAKDPAVFADRAGLSPEAASARFFMVEEIGVGPDYPLSGEKLSLILTLYRAKDFADAKRIVREILAHQGAGHSVGIHTKDHARAHELAADIDAVRVLVNQAHAVGNGGSFDNGLNFTLSMGCGTWAGNSISENLNWHHFVNVTHLSTTIPEDKPSEEALFGPHWDTFGK